MRHTHGVTASAAPPSANGRSGTSVGQVFAAVAGFVALAAIGAAIGWGVTKAPVKPTGGPSLSPSPSVSASTPNPPSSPPVSPTVSASGGLLDYTGQPFQQVRDALRSQKLGVTLVFQSTGPVGALVTSTSPAAGAPVHPGLTIKVMVDGVPPPLAVPSPQGPTKCSDWGKFLSDTGFIPDYTPPGSKNLLVAGESPGPDDPTTVWNEKITLTCTADGQMPPSGPASAPASAPASGDPSP